MPENAKKILHESIVVDGLFHSLLADPPPTEYGTDIVDLLVAGGVTAINATVVLDTYKNDLKTFLSELHKFFILEEAYAQKVVSVRDYSDIEKAKATKRLAVILGLQGADAIEQDLRYIAILHRLGVRIIQITYNQRNNLGSGVFEPNDTGLTRFGQQSIYEMNRLGIVIDLSHVGYRTSLDAIEVSQDPVVFSHVGVKALNKNARNIRDDQITAVAAKGGVVGLCPHSVMCMKEKGKRPTADDFIDQIEYVMKLTSEDNVGIGTDRWMRPTMTYKLRRIEFERTLPGFFGSFSGEEKHVNGFNYYDEWESLTDHLMKRGHSESVIKKILGGNFCRVFQKVWK